MAEIVRTTLTDHRKKAVNVQLVTEALYGPQVRCLLLRCLLSGLDYCPDDVVNIWEAVSESDDVSWEVLPRDENGRLARDASPEASWPCFEGRLPPANP